MELAASKPSALPYPAVGTRLAFQLVYPDLRGTSAVNDAAPRYAVKDLGSIVIGQGGPGAETSEFGETGGSLRGEQEIGRTLGDARFVVGDYVSCAILPTLSDGSVAPASSARRDAGTGMREGRGLRGGFLGRENGFGHGGARGGRGGGWRDDMGGRFPMGEWKRGETLPDPPPRPPRPRGGGRW
ncbi:Histone deacetylase complex subunit SAP18 [Tolypocladium paradoxum]|uniref:Histone deacetylase complex subunit SAP18 n=1 Tax=Tolypocladium paradoxum TaxID=94208 RepID=A0A2S4LB91_9HYPO|nr:Histone deacetylase complex subunit SAP18 [Tolypocladium paradoxum]